MEWSSGDDPAEHATAAPQSCYEFAAKAIEQRHAATQLVFSRD